MDKNSNLYFWGMFIGFIIGLMVAKIYQSWAILFRMRGKDWIGITSWYQNGIDAPLWVLATDYPAHFTLAVTASLSFAGFLFVRTIINKKVIFVIHKNKKK